jgi:hypothetical protein
MQHDGRGRPARSAIDADRDATGLTGPGHEKAVAAVRDRGRADGPGVGEQRGVAGAGIGGRRLGLYARAAGDLAGEEDQRRRPQPRGARRGLAEPARIEDGGRAEASKGRSIVLPT